MQELRPSLWRWTARHPDWKPEQPGESEYWGPDVGSVLWSGAGVVVLIDPLVVDDETWRAIDAEVERAGTPPQVLLSIFWHKRSAPEVLRRYDGARVWAQRLAPAAARQYANEPLCETDTFEFGERLPGDVVAVETGRGSEVLFWIEARRALVTGDVLLGDDRGGLAVAPDEWLRERKETTYAQLRTLDLPVELVLPAHGRPVDADARAVLARAVGA